MKLQDIFQFTLLGYLEYLGYSECQGLENFPNIYIFKNLLHSFLYILTNNIV